MFTKNCLILKFSKSQKTQWKLRLNRNFSFKICSFFWKCVVLKRWHYPIFRSKKIFVCGLLDSNAIRSELCPHDPLFGGENCLHRSSWRHSGSLIQAQHCWINRLPTDSVERRKWLEGIRVPIKISLILSSFADPLHRFVMNSIQNMRIVVTHSLSSHWDSQSLWIIRSRSKSNPDFYPVSYWQ